MSSTTGAEPLAGRTAVVTGASRGIGLAIARTLIGDGARVVMIARGEHALQAAATALGERAVAVAGDVAAAAHVPVLTANVRHALGDAPDVLVNSAGAFAVAPVAATAPDTFAGIVEANLVGPFRLIHAFLPAMRTRGRGHIITIGSIADRAILPGNAAYAASKFGARALHEVLRLETRGSGVRATLIAPGPVDTPLWDSIDPDRREGLPPRARMLPPAAVAEAVRYVVTQPAHVNVDELRLSYA